MISSHNQNNSKEDVSHVGEVKRCIFIL